MEFVDTTHSFGTSWRKVMMWWFIVTDGLLFACFLASYGYARVLAFHWPQQSDVFSLKYIAVMTFVKGTCVAIALNKSWRRFATASLLVVFGLAGNVIHHTQA